MNHSIGVRPVDLVLMRGRRNTLQPKVLVDHEFGSQFTISPFHLLSSDPEVLGTGPSGRVAAQFQRVLVASLVAEVKLGQFAPGRRERTEIGRKGNAGQLLGQVAGEALPIGGACSTP